ncbi:hypothetical protein KUCAC02_015582 [Chaenocephalus aceratus]|uniref:Uncharacterized protein n=1 Tax=Chaenocephalus aceratus TaxID=36190 RepID=A0ACB9XYT3_CHAAC|nr:hypothetical protein KUCAC02_015582 [Chaenocephalus aceratus]
MRGSPFLSEHRGSGQAQLLSAQRQYRGEEFDKWLPSCRAAWRGEGCERGVLQPSPNVSRANTDCPRNTGTDGEDVDMD